MQSMSLVLYTKALSFFIIVESNSDDTGETRCSGLSIKFAYRKYFHFYVLFSHTRVNIKRNSDHSFVTSNCIHPPRFNIFRGISLDRCVSQIPRQSSPGANIRQTGEISDRWHSGEEDCVLVHTRRNSVIATPTD